LVSPSDGDGVGRAPRVGAGGDQTGFRISEDRLDAAGEPGPIGPFLDLVSACGERVARAWLDTDFDGEPAGKILVRREAGGELITGDARRLDGALQIHAEMQHVE
jgi:hypothetical protein